MELSRPISELVHERSSWRRFEPLDLPDDLVARVERLLAATPRGPFGHSVRLALLPASPSQRTEARRLGTYGVIDGAAYFLAGAIEDGPLALEDYGYVFELAVLQLTALGLGTCWLGGTFRRGDFGDALHIRGNEIVPAVSPVGRPASRRSLVDHAFRFAAGSKHRKPWSDLFFDGDLEHPLSPERAGPWADVLELVRLAPSASNKQPWRIVRDADRWHFLMKRTPGYRNALLPDLQRVDMGIALCHFQLGAQEAGRDGQFTIEDPMPAGLPRGMSHVCTWVPAKARPTERPTG